MLLPLRKAWPSAVAFAAVALLGMDQAYAQDPSLFDLEWDGPETSTVEECYGGDNFCHTFPITGSVGVVLAADAPSLVNVNSDILLPPQVPGSPPVISPNLWFNFDLLVGEYLPTADESLSMVFRPAEIGGVLRAYELLVNIADDGQFLQLTGGIEQSAASPLEPDVRFSVSGRLVAGDAGTPNVPEPSTLLLLPSGILWVIRSRHSRS